MLAVLAVLVIDVAGGFDRTWLADWYLWSVFAVGGVLCVVRARQAPRERLVWLLFAAGWGFYVAGGIVFQVFLDGSSAHFPSAADVLWLGLYIVDLAAVAALMHPLG